MFIQLIYFPFSISGYFGSADVCVAVLFLMSFFALYYEVFSSYPCIDAILNAGESFSSLFSWHVKSVNVISAM